VLDLTRAWTLVRFFDADILQLTPCCRCSGKFIGHKHDLQHNVVCDACQPPSRAGKTKKAAAAKRDAQPQVVEVRHAANDVEESIEIVAAVESIAPGVFAEAVLAA